MPVSTPEGLVFKLKPAGAYARALAFMLDLLVVGSAFFVIAFFFSLIGFQGKWILLLFFFAMQWLYTALFEGFNAGRTPGKMLMGLQVVHDDGTPVDFGSALLRNLIRAADSPIMAFGFGMAVMSLTGGFKRLGDMAAGTIVIYKPRKRGSADAGMNALVRVGVKKMRLDIVPTPPPRQLSADEAAAITSYAQRFDQFSTARARGLAESALLALYGKDRPPGNPPDLLLGLAAWLLGIKPEAADTARTVSAL